MAIKYPLMYFCAGLMFGVSIMWITPESHVGISDNQLDELSIKISKNIHIQESGNVQVTSAYEAPITSSDSYDISSEQVDYLKAELALVIVDELRIHKDQMLSEINNNNLENVNVSDHDYEQYNQAQSMLYDVANGTPLSFQQFASDSRVKDLPEELRNKLMGEVAMKLTSGELNPDVFLGRNN